MTAAATAASQQLSPCGRALVQRAQEPNIPFGESLTSMKTSLHGYCTAFNQELPTLKTVFENLCNPESTCSGISDPKHVQKFVDLSFLSILQDLHFEQMAFEVAGLGYLDRCDS